MCSAKPQETVKFWVMPHLNNLELLCATYIRHSFSKHIHEGFGIGVIERGALEFFYRREKLIAPSGYINLVIPGEAHDGHAASDTGWSYRMFYLEPKLLEQAAFEISGSTKGVPFFSAGVIKDAYLAGVIRNLHLLLEKPDIPLIEQESHLLIMLVMCILRHANDSLSMRRLGKENQAVNRVREYIEDNYTQNISIQILAKLCGLSPFHLIRVFRECVGVPPHLYLKQVRINRAKKLLVRGFSPAFVAHEVGFVDQSHFSKHFKEIIGITPNKYRKFTQELSSTKLKMYI
ncbi:MAG TPA: AraC family transcriptional regulator [Methylomusa anaerophila]|uniref:Bifunctional transcriptional activator/DNA repair enzyme AdaA n=1 Tax=Methylomusa anaerophila TaxID=1930071 RepID=A0A348AEL0_9FIRM|nr:AraC family transcriptional regulator [Methylomusa anaerophila]BBB89508.1 bifunctional transcriptional activator/DNA repair enzyme AdaA [Methylomusa anaerophila]HML90122.1 AraC family transcriptional regulator [Methylomusa anaerophila]